jgi:dolichol-phosphate mannosyltransferase
MASKPEISIIIPCLNEEQNIPVLIQKLDAVIKKYNLNTEILIIDDCSDDYTFREAFILEGKNSKVRALHKGLPRGIGNTIRHGIENARGKVGVVVMGDCVDPLSAIPDFRRKIVEEGYHLVLLSRYLNPEDSETIPFSYKFYHFGFRIFCKYLIGISLRDITYAFRGFDLDFIKRLDLESNGFEISPEVTIKTWLNSGKVCEIRGKQGRRLQGESKFFFSKVGFGYTRILLKGIVMKWMGKKM